MLHEWRSDYAKNYTYVKTFESWRMRPTTHIYHFNIRPSCSSNWKTEDPLNCCWLRNRVPAFQLLLVEQKTRFSAPDLRNRRLASLLLIQEERTRSTTPDICWAPDLDSRTGELGVYFWLRRQQAEISQGKRVFHWW